MNKTILEYFVKQLDRVDKWLTFAEAKNAALIVLNSGIIAKCIDLYFKEDTISIRCYIISAMIIGVISLSMSLYTFMPNISSKIKMHKGNYKENPNLVFYNDISEFYDADEYVKIVKLKYGWEIDGQENGEEIPYIRDLAQEIIINSQITVKNINGLSGL